MNPNLEYNTPESFSSLQRKTDRGNNSTMYASLSHTNPTVPMSEIYDLKSREQIVMVLIYYTASGSIIALLFSPNFS